MSDQTPSSAARIEELRQKFEKDPNSKIFLQLGEEYRKVNRFDEAIAVCRQGLSRHPNYTSARVTLGRAYLGARKVGEAKSEFEAVLEVVPDNILANRYLGDILYEEGSSAEALDRYRMVQMLNPNDAEVVERIDRLERGPVPAARPEAKTAAPAAAAAGGDPDEGYMDLKIDESLILNADLVAQTLAKRGMTPPAPPSPPPPRPPAAQPAVAAPRPTPVASADEVEMPGFDAIDAADELGGVGFDDYSEFSSPTVMLNAADLHSLGVLPEKESKEPDAKAEAVRPVTPLPPPPPPPARPALPGPPGTPPGGGAPARDLAGFAARSAEKYGLRPYGSPPEPASAPRTVPAEEPAEEKVPARPTEGEARDEEVGGFGMDDDFSEFAAPTVMLNVADLAAGLAKAPEPQVSASAAAAQPSFGPERSAWSEAGAVSVSDAGEAAGGGSWGEGPMGEDGVFSDLGAALPDDDSVPTAASEEEFGTRALSVDDLRAETARAAATSARGEPRREAGGEALPGGQEADYAASGALLDELGSAASEAPFGDEASAFGEAEAGGGFGGEWGGSLASEESALTSEESALTAEESGLASEEADLTSKTLGQLYLQQGHLEKALEIFSRYLASSPGDAEVRARVQEIQVRLGRVSAPAPAPGPVPAPAPHEEAEPETRATEVAEGAEDRRQKIRKLSSWLSSIKKS